MASPGQKVQEVEAMIGLADRPEAATEKREIGIECEDELSFLEEHLPLLPLQ